MPLVESVLAKSPRAVASVPVAEDPAPTATEPVETASAPMAIAFTPVAWAPNRSPSPSLPIAIAPAKVAWELLPIAVEPVCCANAADPRGRPYRDRVNPRRIRALPNRGRIAPLRGRACPDHGRTSYPRVRVVPTRRGRIQVVVGGLDDLSAGIGAFDRPGRRDRVRAQGGGDRQEAGAGQREPAGKRPSPMGSAGSKRLGVLIAVVRSIRGRQIDVHGFLPCVPLLAALVARRVGSGVDRRGILTPLVG